MEKRRLGKTGHMSTVVNFGTVAIGSVPQAEADRLIEEALARGINHFDLAPTYADAELRLSDYLKRHPQPNLFISCKTNRRPKAEAREELNRTLDRIGRDKFDLYQLHAVCNMKDLEDCFAPGGSLEAILDARAEGLVTHIGITGHGWESAAAHAAALRRFDFATVMTSCNLFMMQNPDFAAAWNDLMGLCRAQDVGVHVLKAIARISWGARERTAPTWYEPFTAQEDIDRAVAWVLHQPVTTLCSAGEATLFRKTCDAAERYTQIPEAIAAGLLNLPNYGDIFAEA